jgi:hypothetical protein
LAVSATTYRWRDRSGVAQERSDAGVPALAGFVTKLTSEGD